ncbi:uroporphyrinogen-III synthase [Candidatus Nitrospira bockiana]
MPRSPDPTVTRSGFDGLHVAAFESRMAAEMERLITRYGGQPVVVPALKEIPLEANADALAFGDRLVAGEVDVVILLTGVGTRTLLDLLGTRHPREVLIRALRATTLVARGPKPVAALKEAGLSPHLVVPEPNTWRELLQVLDARHPVAHQRVAVQEYGASNPELLAALTERGAEVIRVPVYRWAMPDDRRPLEDIIQAILAGRISVILITNAAQVDHLLEVARSNGQLDALLQAAGRLVVASIGPTASERLRRARLPVDLEPSHPKMGLLVKETAERCHALLASKAARP